MSPELALLDEVWTTVKPHIQKKDRLEVAETILKMFDDHLSLDGIEDYRNEFDSVMKAAVVSLYDYYEDEDEDSDYDR